jgi:glycosidase
MSPSGRTNRKKTKAQGLAAPPRPAIYEINTRLWLRELSRQYAAPITLADVPAEVWDYLAEYRFDAVWLMGVWERSPAGRAMALENEALLAAFAAALPDARAEDIVGSPYCIRQYEVDAEIGGRVGLAAARAELARRGMTLILDFVPNHTAPDHPWIADHPAYYVRGTASDLARAPLEFFETGDAIIAKGRDPHSPPWPDVAQLNGFDPGQRRAAIATLRDIAGQCDGVRCDMAMLMTTEFFCRSWGERDGPPPILF